MQPAKVLFLNNAINFGAFTPFGVVEAAQNGKPIHFLLETNPGPDLGLLLAYWVAGKGWLKQTAPRLLIATDVNDERLAVLREQFGPLTDERGKQLVLISPTKAERSLHDTVRELSNGRGADDVIVSVPAAAIMVDAATLMAPDGMLVLFAGVPNGTLAPLNISDVYLHNAQFTGTSGSSLNDQAAVIRKTEAHELTPNRSVAAVGGMEAARDGIQVMMEGRYPGKIVIFPQVSGLPLTGSDELHEQQPDVAAAFGPNDMWTPEAEQRLIAKSWQP